MTIAVIGDIWWESKLLKLLHDIRDNGFNAFFTSRDYGSSVSELVIGVTCPRRGLKLERPVEYGEKRRSELTIGIIRDLEPAWKALNRPSLGMQLCIDVIFDFEQMK